MDLTTANPAPALSVVMPVYNAAAFVSAANGAGVAFGAKFSLNLFNGW